MSRPLALLPTRHMLVFLAGLMLFVPLAEAQTRFVYNKGLSVSPAYEGWMPNKDGSFTLYFGYMNPNWQEEFEVPIGPDNSFEPGQPDRGQPTHFYPRRNPFLFTVQVPSDFGTQELVWTITTHGKTQKVYGSLKTDYALDGQVISTEVGGDMGSTADKLRDNIPPELKVDGSAQRTVKVGELFTLTALAGDPDNYPPRRDGKPQPRHPGEPIHATETSTPTSNEASPRRGMATSGDVRKLIYTPPAPGVPISPAGLRLSWIVYRGKGSAVTFSPSQMETWEDTRAFAYSPWAYPNVIPEPPSDGKWVTQVKFAEPGTYVLRAIASDSALFTYENVTVIVTQ
jgi:hypothetical protein